MARRLVLGVLVAAVGWQLLSVTLAAIPPNRVSAATEPSRAYLEPYFNQNWRLFAPNPVADDRTIRVQGSYRDEAGEVVQTRWIDWTDVELDLIHHRLVGNRGGYVTNKAIEGLGAAYRPLNDEQRRVVEDGDDAQPDTWAALDRRLLRAGALQARRGRYLRYERAMARLASDVLAAREPGREWLAVRYAVVLRPVTPYADRDGGERPPAVERLSGWRTPVRTSAEERSAVADFDRRHR